MTSSTVPTAKILQESKMRTAVLLCLAFAFQAWSVPVDQNQLVKRIVSGSSDPELTMDPVSAKGPSHVRICEDDVDFRIS